MTIETLMTDMRKAMRLGEKLEVEVLRGIIAAVKKAAIDKRCEITEELVDEILLKEQKIIQEMIDTCPASREDLLENYRLKKSIIDFYAPILITDGVIILEKIIKILENENVDKNSLTQGELKKIVMPQLKGRVDMKVANAVIKSYF